MSTDLHATWIDVQDIDAISHRESRTLALTEYRRFADVVGRLSGDDWTRPTTCDGWTVRDMVGHVVGAMRSAASIREMLRQQREIARRVKTTGGNEVDHMTALQIELTSELELDALVAECRSLAEPAARGRSRTPWVMRRLVKFPVEMGPISERWTLGYLVDVILTRDTFMHRLEVSRAVGVELVEDADHDGRLIADIVAEWARRHGQPFELVLTGPAGGRFAVAGTEPAALELDAIEFCLLVSGRGETTGLLTQQVPF